MTVKLKASRDYPSIPAVTGDLENHTLVLQQMREALETGQRRTNDVLNSFVRVKELVDLGLLKLEGNTTTVVSPGVVGGGGGASLPAGTNGHFLRFNGSWVSGPLQAIDVAQGFVTQHQAALSINYSQLTGTPTGYPPQLAHSGI